VRLSLNDILLLHSSGFFKGSRVRLVEQFQSVAKRRHAISSGHGAIAHILSAV